MLCDAHLHLQDAVFEQKTADIITAAQAAGVGRFFCASETLDDSEKLLALAKNHPQIVPFIGTHPSHAAAHDNIRFLKMLAANPSVGIGETGLDARFLNAPQEDVFARHVAAAVDFDRPFAVHCVKAAAGLIGVLKRFSRLPPFLCHAFYGGRNEIAFLAEKGAYFSLNARFFSRPNFKKKLAFYPPDRLLIETDSPFMRPDDALCVRAEEKHNVPANLSLTFKRLAQMLSVSETDLHSRLDANAAAFLREKK